MGSSTRSRSRRHVWRGTGSKTTKRGAERVAEYPCAAAADGQKESAAGNNRRAARERTISHFFAASVRSAGGQSRLCATLRPLRGAKNAALTHLPLRSCVASSH